MYVGVSVCVPPKHSILPNREQCCVHPCHTGSPSVQSSDVLLLSANLHFHPSLCAVCPQLICRLSSEFTFSFCHHLNAPTHRRACTCVCVCMCACELYECVCVCVLCVVCVHTVCVCIFAGETFIDHEFSLFLHF